MPYASGCVDSATENFANPLLKLKASRADPATENFSGSARVNVDFTTGNLRKTTTETEASRGIVLLLIKRAGFESL